MAAAASPIGIAVTVTSNALMGEMKRTVVCMISCLVMVLDVNGVPRDCVIRPLQLFAIR